MVTLMVYRYVREKCRGADAHVILLLGYKLKESVMRRLILASASPRRRELLTQAGFLFEVRPADVNEDACGNEDPIAYVVRLARDKAEAVFSALKDSDAIVLGAD